MKILDRYILRQFLLNFVILLAVFVLLFVLVDVTLDLDEYLDAAKANVSAGKFSDLILATLYAVVDYDGPIVVLLYVFFSGLLVVGAMGFTYAGLHRGGELVAMVTSGISMYRVSASVLLAGFALNLLTLPVQEYLIPRLAPKLARGKSEMAAPVMDTFSVYYAVDRSGALLSASQFVPASQTLAQVNILERDAAGLVRARVMADSADWSPAPEGWILHQGRRTLAELVDMAAGPQAQVEAVTFFPTELSPQVLMARQASILPRLLSVAELQKLSRNPTIARTVPVRQIMWRRFSLLVMNCLILLMGLPFFLLREPSNMLLQGVKAAGLCLGAWGLGLILLETGSRAGGADLPPAFVAWLPVALYLPVSMFMLQRVKT